MSTRGLYGFKKDGVMKVTYNHFDSYPDGLGRSVIEFISGTTLEQLHSIFDNIVLVNSDSQPSEEQIAYCQEKGYCSLSVGSQSVQDWYCLLRNLQGDFEILKSAVTQKLYMIDDKNFLEDGLFCEYAYIIDLSDGTLDFYNGEEDVCLSLPLSDIQGEAGNTNVFVSMMELSTEEDIDIDNILETIATNSNYELSVEDACALEGRRICMMHQDKYTFAESYARSLGILTDENERYFDLDLLLDDLDENDEYIELPSGLIAQLEV